MINIIQCGIFIEDSSTDFLNFTIFCIEACIYSFFMYCRYIKIHPSIRCTYMYNAYTLENSNRNKGEKLNYRGHLYSSCRTFGKLENWNFGIWLFSYKYIYYIMSVPKNEKSPTKKIYYFTNDCCQNWHHLITQNILSFFFFIIFIAIQNNVTELFK